MSINAMLDRGELEAIVNQALQSSKADETEVLISAGDESHWSDHWCVFLAEGHV